jgi:hypothetical protein
MEQSVDNFFIDDNKVSAVISEEYCGKASDAVMTLDALARMTCKSLYVFS